MSHQFDRPVCAPCGKVFNEQLNDADEWHEGTFDIPIRHGAESDGEEDHLCPECHAVIVEGEPEIREWLKTLPS